MERAKKVRKPFVRPSNLRGLNMEALRRELLNSSDMQEEFNKYEADPRREEWLKDYSEG